MRKFVEEGRCDNDVKVLGFLKKKGEGRACAWTLV